MLLSITFSKSFKDGMVTSFLQNFGGRNTFQTRFGGFIKYIFKALYMLFYLVFS
jgi:hypothetical protein